MENPTGSEYLIEQVWRKSQASIRVIPGCYITGQAAGFAAASAADRLAGDVHAVDVKALQRTLKDFGAYLPNA